MPSLRSLCSYQISMPPLDQRRHAASTCRSSYANFTYHDAPPLNCRCHHAAATVSVSDWHPPPQLGLYIIHLRFTQPTQNIEKLKGLHSVTCVETYVIRLKNMCTWNATLIIVWFGSTVYAEKLAILLWFPRQSSVIDVFHSKLSVLDSSAVTCLGCDEVMI